MLFHSFPIQANKIISFNLTDIGEGINEVTIKEWLVLDSYMLYQGNVLSFTLITLCIIGCDLFWHCELGYQGKFNGDELIFLLNGEDFTSPVKKSKY
jgi:hypothetical protein